MPLKYNYLLLLLSSSLLLSLLSLSLLSLLSLFKYVFYCKIIGNISMLMCFVSSIFSLIFILSLCFLYKQSSRLFSSCGSVGFTKVSDGTFELFCRIVVNCYTPLFSAENKQKTLDDNRRLKAIGTLFSGLKLQWKYL